MSIDIWYAIDKNILSNLSPRPFVDDHGRQYINVEHAYQTWKSGSFDQTTWDKYFSVPVGKKINGKKGTKTGNNWNITLMKKIIKMSLVQNPDVLTYLKATGKTTLTHKRDTGIWKTVFPTILMELRDEL